MNADSLPPHVLIGACLVGVGVLDIVLSMTLLRARTQAGPQRTVVVGAMASGGALMILLGGAFLAGVIPLD